MIDPKDFQQKLERHKANVAKVNGLNKDAVFAPLSGAAITLVQVNFDGEGDSGQIQYVGAFAGEKRVEFPAITVTLHSSDWGGEELTTREMPLREAVEELCYGYLQQEYDGWENNDGAFGEFTLDVAERSIALEFNGRFTDYVQSNHTF